MKKQIITTLSVCVVLLCLFVGMKWYSKNSSLSNTPSQTTEIVKNDFLAETIQIPNTMNRATPEFQSFSLAYDTEGNNYISVGVGGKLDLPANHNYVADDMPGAGIWKVEVNKSVALQEIAVTEALKQKITYYKFGEIFSPDCSDTFTFSCLSTDGRLKIVASFSGSEIKKKKLAGWMSGQTGDIETTFYTGIRTISMMDTTNNKQAVIFREQLNDTDGYSAIIDRLAYFPAKKIVIFMALNGAASTYQAPTVYYFE